MMTISKEKSEQYDPLSPLLKLNSDFTQSEAKRQILCPPGLVVTPKEFYDAFVTQLAQNSLPAHAMLQLVSWDNGQRPQEMIIVAFTGNEVPADIVRLVIGFKQMGNFLYIERMLTFLPPVLPEVGTKQPLLSLKASRPTLTDSARGFLVIAGGIALIVGIFSVSVVFLIIGVIVLCYALVTASTDARLIQVAERENPAIKSKNQEITTRNQRIEQEQKALIEITERWVLGITQYFYLARVDDVFGRWIGAVSLTLDQVIKQIFVDRQAQADAWEIQQKTQQEIEQQMQKLKEKAMR